MNTIVETGVQTKGFLTKGQYFDGIRPVPQDATCWIDQSGQNLEIQSANSKTRWSLAKIREVPDQSSKDIYALRLSDTPLPRLILPNDALRPYLPYPTRHKPNVKRSKLAIWSAAALGSVALIVFGLVPLMAHQLAGFIPPEGERALGEATLKQIQTALNDNTVGNVRFCSSADGRAALTKMQDRLETGLRQPVELSVHVLDHGMVNAFALPGGYIVLFRGLIDAAETPEEVAAVFAHEIGHAVSRDPTRHALRSAGSIGVLGLLLGDFAGGVVVLFLAERLIDAHYSQSAEAAADAFAHDLLLRSHLSPGALSQMFERFRALGGERNGLQAHFASHPELGDRIAKAEAAVPPGFRPVPLMTNQEWRALQNICRHTRAEP